MRKETAIEILRSAWNILREVEFELATSHPGQKEAGNDIFEAEKLISSAVERLRDKTATP